MLRLLLILEALTLGVVGSSITLFIDPAPRLLIGLLGIGAR